MTDEHMDARLRAAGEQWRSSNDTAAGVDVAATVAASDTEVLAPAPRRQRHWGLFASAAVVAAALVVGGALVLPGGDHPTGNPELNNAGLVGRVWELVGYNNGPDLRESSTSTLYIGPDGQLVADDSCAVVGAKADVGDGQLTVTDQVVRYRSCTDSVGEIVFTHIGTDVLNGTADYQITENGMTISRAGNTMHFVAAPDDLPAPSLDVPTFVGAHWKLIRVFDADGNDVRFDGDIPFYVADDGSLTASDGCNQLTGTVTGIVRVHFDNVGGTEIGCPPAQTVIQAVLNGTADEQVSNDATMTLKKDGAGELVYQWVPGDNAATDPHALDGKTWRLRSVAGQPAVSDASVTISGTTYTANDGCQDFNGDVGVGPGTIRFSGVPTGNPPCGGEGASQASTIDSFLGTPSLWAIRDEELIISGGGAQAFSLVYASGSNPPPTVTNPGAELIGPNWYLTAIVNEEATSSSGTPVDARLVLTFDGQGGVRLSETCAKGVGSVVLGAGTANFSEVELGGHCPADAEGDLSAHDTATVLQTLGQTRWSVDGNQLSITNGHTSLTFSTTAPPTSLLGTRWTLSGFELDNPGSAAGGGSSSGTGSLQFNDDGTFVVHGGCTPLQGRAEIDGATVVFSDVSPIGGHCIDTYVDRERAIDLIFQDGTASRDLSDGQLTLSGNGATAHFVRE